mgnify:CR=1 FL=1
MLLSQARRGIEKLHLDYLCSQFNFSQPSFENGPAFDLVFRNVIFELKSRTFPLNQENERKRFRSDYAWWQLDEQQIKRYERWVNEKNYSLSWIFVLGDVMNNLTLSDSFSETDVLHREIYIVPWDVYKKVSVNPQGTYRNMGLGKIKSDYEFILVDVLKGKLFIEKSIENDKLF